MDVVTIRHKPPALRSPVLIAAFTGWNDAGEAASGAATVLRRAIGGSAFARIEPEDFFDFQATRPTVRVVNGGSRRIDWPENRFSWGELPGADRHAVVLEGTEPNLRWRSFSGAIVGLAADLGVELVITMGALQVDAPHTRPVPISGSASTPELLAGMGLRRSRYEGPTGITGVLHHSCAEAGMQAISMWAGVPHYLAGTAYLAGALALAERTAGLLNAELSLDRLARDAADQREDIGRLVAEDDDLAEYVAELEQRTGASSGDGDPELPAADVSGDDLAAEFERYLRDRGEG